MQLNQQELQNLRHLINSHETAHQKLRSYSEQADDPQVKQMFEKSAQDAMNTKQKLMSFLSGEGTTQDLKIKPSYCCCG